MATSATASQAPAAAAAAPSRDWSSHPKLARVFKQTPVSPASQAGAGYHKKIRALVTFYNESSASESGDFNRDCYSLVYRLVLDTLHACGSRAWSGGGLAGSGGGSSVGSSRGASVGGEDDRSELEVVRSALGVLRRLMEDAHAVFRARWQARSVAQLLQQLTLHANHFAIRTRGVHLLLTYLNLFSPHPSPHAHGGTEWNAAAAAATGAEFGPLLRDAIDLRPFLTGGEAAAASNAAVAASGGMALSALSPASRAAHEWAEHLERGTRCSGPALVFPSFASPSRARNATEDAHANLHLLESVLGFVLGQATARAAALADGGAPGGSLSPSTAAAAAHAQAVQFQWWLSILQSTLFTGLYPAMAESMGFSNTGDTNAAARDGLADHTSSSASASASLHSARCLGFRPLCPLPLHTLVLSWLLKALELPSLASSFGGESSAASVMQQVCASDASLSLLVEVFRQSFLVLPLDHAPLLQSILHIFSEWVRGATPTPVLMHRMQPLLRGMLDHCFPAFCIGRDSPADPMAQYDDDMLFDDSSDVASGGAGSGGHSGGGADRTHVALCSSVIQLYTLIAAEPFVVLSAQSWEHLLLTLLNATNYLVKMRELEAGDELTMARAASPRRSSHDEAAASQLLAPLLSCLFDCYLRSCVGSDIVSDEATDGEQQEGKQKSEAAASHSTLPPPSLLASSSSFSTSSASLLLRELESKVRGWLHGSVHGVSSAASGRAVIEGWKSKLLWLTRQLLAVLSSATAQEATARARNGAQGVAALNPIRHGHRVGSMHSLTGAASAEAMRASAASPPTHRRSNSITLAQLASPSFSSAARLASIASRAPDSPTATRDDSMVPCIGSPPLTARGSPLLHSDAAIASLPSLSLLPTRFNGHDSSAHQSDFADSFRTWLSFLRLIGPPSLIVSPHCRRIAWKGVVESLLLLLDAGAQPLLAKKLHLTLQSRAASGATDAVEEMLLSTLARKYLPEGDTLLLLFAPLLFDAVFDSGAPGRVNNSSGMSSGFLPISAPTLPSASPLLLSSPSLGGWTTPGGMSSSSLQARCAFSIPGNNDSLGVRAMCLAALARILCTRTAYTLPSAFLIAFAFQVRVGLSSGAWHMEWTLLRQCATLFAMDHLLPHLYVILPEVMRALNACAPGATSAEAQAIQESATEGTPASGRKKKKKSRNGSSAPSTPRRRSTAPAASKFKRRPESPEEVRAACVTLLGSLVSLPFHYGQARLISLPPLPSSSTLSGSHTPNSRPSLTSDLPPPALGAPPQAAASIAMAASATPRVTSSLILSSILTRARADAADADESDDFSAASLDISRLHVGGAPSSPFTSSPASSPPSTTCASPAPGLAPLLGAHFTGGPYNDFASLKGDVLHLLLRVLHSGSVVVDAPTRAKAVWTLFVLVSEECECAARPPMSDIAAVSDSVLHPPSHSPAEVISLVVLRVTGLILPPTLPPSIALSSSLPPLLSAEQDRLLSSLQTQSLAALSFLLSLAPSAETLMQQSWSGDGVPQLWDELQTRLREVSAGSRVRWNAAGKPEPSSESMPVASLTPEASIPPSLLTSSIAETILISLCVIGHSLLTELTHLTSFAVSHADPQQSAAQHYSSAARTPMRSTDAASTRHSSNGTAAAAAANSSSQAAPAAPSRSTFSPLCHSYMSLYARLLQQLLQCVAEWLMSSASLQGTMCSDSHHHRSSGCVPPQACDLEGSTPCLRCRIFDLVYAAMQFSPANHVNERGEDATNSKNANGAAAVLDSERVCSELRSRVSESALSVLHVLHRVHHFPFRCDDDNDAALPFSDASRTLNLPLESDASGSLVSSITEENDPRIDLSPLAQLVSVRVRVADDGVQLSISACRIASLPAASESAVLHFAVDDSVLVSAFERPAPIPGLDTATIVRIIVRDPTGKYVIDCDQMMPAGMAVLREQQSERQQSSAPSRLPLSTGTQRRERQQLLELLQSEWATLQSESNASSLASLAASAPSLARHDVQQLASMESLSEESHAESQVSCSQPGQHSESDGESESEIELHASVVPLATFQPSPSDLSDPLTTLLQLVDDCSGDSLASLGLTATTPPSRARAVAASPTLTPLSLSSSPASLGLHAAPAPPSDDEGASTVTFFDRANLRIQEDTFGEVIEDDTQTASGARLPAAMHLTPAHANGNSSEGATSSRALSSLRASLSSFDLCRSPLARLYLTPALHAGLSLRDAHLVAAPASGGNGGSTTGGPAGRLRCLADSSKVRRALKLLDANPSRECHKIGVLYVGPAQDSQRAILANEYGSPIYHAFLRQLGRLVALESHCGFVGGLDALTNGSVSLSYCTATIDVMFHVSTLMPSRPIDIDEQQIHKKRHLGNDHVQIVWSEHSRDYRPSCIPSQFNHAHIVIYPFRRVTDRGASLGVASPASPSLASSLFRIGIAVKSGVSAFGPLSDGMVVRGTLLAPLVRLTAVNANRAVRHANPAYAPPATTRASYIQQLCRQVATVPTRCGIEAHESLLQTPEDAALAAILETLFLRDSRC